MVMIFVRMSKLEDISLKNRNTILPFFKIFYQVLLKFGTQNRRENLFTD
jgi:hypothetical protein